MTFVLKIPGFAMTGPPLSKMGEVALLLTSDWSLDSAITARLGVINFCLKLTKHKLSRKIFFNALQNTQKSFPLFLKQDLIELPCTYGIIKHKTAIF
jgi:hypothetical protein